MNNSVQQPPDIPKPIGLAQYETIERSLNLQLHERLQEEVDMSEFETKEEDNDLYDDLPVVDSKTVVKLSPLVERMTGRKIDIAWIKKGGYDSVSDAVDDLLSHVKNACEH